MENRTVRVGIIGSGYIAAAHSAAYRHVAGTYPELVSGVELAAAADVDGTRAEALAARWGWARWTTDWRQITRNEDVDVVDICVPNHLHAEIAIDAFAHGKHVICEKPMAAELADAEAMAAACEQAPGIGQVCFYYRTWPAISWIRQLLDDGSLGSVRHVRGWMLQDYAAREDHDLGWRAKPALAGAGALGDLGSHIIDLVLHLVGPIESVVSSTGELVRPQGRARGTDDIVSALVRFESGVGGVLEASWALAGHRCDLGIDLVCERGAVRFNWERSNEIQVLMGDVSDPRNGYRTVLLGGGQPDMDHFVAVPGQGVGYRDAFTIGLSRALSAIARGDDEASPSFADGLAVARVVDAISRSDRERAWIELPPVPSSHGGGRQ